MNKIFHDFRFFPQWMKKILWKMLHRVLLARYGNPELKFLNYGYASLNTDGKSLPLSENDELERFCLQLYHHTVSDVNLEGKDILEVGCGRGGGASYITRSLKPNSYFGLDLSKKLIRFCNYHYKNIPNLSFVYGNAEEIPFEDESFDAIINIESSRGYSNIVAFLSGVNRTLRSGGHLLFADLRTEEENEILREQFKNAGLEIIKEENIVQNTLKALDLDYERRYNLIIKKIPRLLKNIGNEFASVKGTKRYESFVDGSLIYMKYVLRKT